MKEIKDKTLLITGGTGSFGNVVLSRFINTDHFKEIRIFSRDEKKQEDQRKRLSDKGGKNCDVLLMTATPIPRTLTMTMYGDMDLSIIREKHKSRKPIKTYSKLESKVDDVIKFIKKEIKLENQVFWVCPLIEESKRIDHSSAVKKFEYLNKLFPNQVSLLHGKTDVDEKENILNMMMMILGCGVWPGTW